MTTTSFIYDALAGRVVFGVGAARTALGSEVERLGGTRVLLIATPREEPVARELTAPLVSIIVATFTGVRPHIPVEVADAARALAAEHRVDLVLTIGGGSTTGTAKAVALTTGIPVLAVPTTYAGSEVTAVWGMTQAQRKTTGFDLKVLPRTVIYDPELTLSLPAAVSAVSGLNAMAHCIEAFWAPGRNPLISSVAEAGIRALTTGLAGVVADGSNMDARGEALLGAWLAGSALAVAGTGLHHKICHVLGGAYGLPHAETHAVVLPHVLAFNAPAVPDAAARIAAALGAADAAAGLVALSARLGAPTALRDLGMDEADLPEATDLVLEKVPADNPRPVSRDDVATILRAAWAGTPAN
jgi:maleylacetate reductase